jgi:POT family proton-dependent oligopeptide transporter
MSQNTADEFFKTLFLDILQDCSCCFYWERFSYYGMRAFVLFLTSSLQKGWSIEDAMALYGTYTMSVYFTPVIGGF